MRTSSDSTSLPDSHAADADRVLESADRLSWGSSGAEVGSGGFAGRVTGGAGGGNANGEEEEERRVDLTDGEAYTHAEFLNFYGVEGPEYWEESPRAAAFAAEVVHWRSCSYEQAPPFPDQSAYEPTPAPSFNVESGGDLDRRWSAPADPEPPHQHAYSHSYRL